MKAALSRCLFLAPPSVPRRFPAALARPYCTPSESKKQRSSKLVNFSLPSDSESDSESSDQKQQKKFDKSNLPPPYNPFDKKPAVEEPEDPKDLQQVFARIREDGLMNSAVKMFDGLSQDGLTHEALQLFSQIKDKGQMPDVVAHTAVVEAYVNAGQAKEAHKVYLRMLMSGVLPNAYTYRVVIRGLAGSGDVRMVKEANKYVVEMVGRGMRPNVETCATVLEALAKVEMLDQGKQLLEMLRDKGVAPEEDNLREAMRNNNTRRRQVYRTMLSLLYGKA